MTRYRILGIAAIALVCVTVILAQTAGPNTKKVPTNTARTDILTTVKNDTTLALFLKHVNKAHLSAVLESKGPLTVFAPTNLAFNSRTQEDINQEHADSTVLHSTIQYHIISGKALTSADLMNMNGQTLTTDNGLLLPVMVQGNQIMVGTARLEGNDILATNGVIHVIDHVLIPNKENVPMNTPLPMGR